MGHFDRSRPWILFSFLVLASCGGRAVVGPGDAGGAGADVIVLPDAAVISPDAPGPCISGGCSSDEECGVGAICGGCFGDPCCPECEACSAQCISSGQTYCNELSNRYLIKLSEARQCAPALDIDQCMFTVDSDFRCPCPVSVNSQAAVTELAAIRSLYLAGGCFGDESWACPAIECPAPQGTCNWIAGETGTCK
jgi:hypothetical protein